MKKLTKQELRAAVAQLRAAILGRTATNQEESIAISADALQVTTNVDTSQELARSVKPTSEYTDTVFIQQTKDHLGVNGKQYDQTNDDIFRLEVSIKELLSEYEVREVAAQHERAKNKDRGQWIERQEEKLAQKAALSGVY